MNEIRHGYCHCGCGRKTNLAPHTEKRKGWVKGEPMRYISRHHARVRFGSLAERFWARVNKDGPMPDARAVAVHPEIAGTPCWIYGKDATKRHTIRGLRHDRVRTHRVAWFLQSGKWPENCLHKCDRPGCVRPSHLFEGTLRDNTQDMIAKKRDAIVGERSSKAKVTWEQVREIRRLGAPCIRHPRKRGTALLKKRLAVRFGTTTRHIDSILRGVRYKDDFDVITQTADGVAWVRCGDGEIIIAAKGENPRAALARQLLEARKERKRQ